MTTIAIVYFYTDKLELSLKAGFLEVLLKTVFYYMHEKLWEMKK